MSIVRRAFAILVVFVSMLAASAAASSRGVAAEDYLAFASLSDPRFSLDGSTTAFVVTTVDQQQNRRRSEIWSVRADGSGKPITLAQAATSPQWSPDGRSLTFLSRRGVAGDGEPRPQVWLLNMSGGEPRRMTTMLNGVSSYQWSPDEQGEQWFRALQHFGVPSEIVFFPRESHGGLTGGATEPKHIVESLNWRVYWFDRYLNANARAVPPDARVMRRKPRRRRPKNP